MPQAPTNPAAMAIERMAKLAAAGSSPSRMVTAIDDVLIQWGAEGLDPSDLRERIEQLQTDIDSGYEAAEEFASLAETPAERSMATSQAVALQAVRNRLRTVIEG